MTDTRSQYSASGEKRELFRLPENVREGFFPQVGLKRQGRLGRGREEEGVPGLATVAPALGG